MERNRLRGVSSALESVKMNGYHWIWRGPDRPRGHRWVYVGRLKHDDGRDYDTKFLLKRNSRTGRFEDDIWWSNRKRAWLVRS